MFARRLVALALTWIILLGAVAVPTLLPKFSSLLTSHPSRDNTPAGALLGCSPLDLRDDLSLALDLARALLPSEEPSLPTSSTKTAPAPADQVQRTTSARPRLSASPAVDQQIAFTADQTAHTADRTFAWQQPSAQYQQTSSRSSVLRL